MLVEYLFPENRITIRIGERKILPINGIPSGRITGYPL